MNYAAKAYMKSRNKWGRINIMIEQINETMEKTIDTENEIFNLFREMTRGLSSKKKVLPITYGKQSQSSQYNQNLGISRNGFCYTYVNYPRYRSRIARTDYELIKLICENKDIILRAVSKKKREILEIFINCLNGVSERKDVEITQEINKTILIPDRDIKNYSFMERKINRIACLMGKHNTHLELRLIVNKVNREIEDIDYEKNMIKEQVYLPCWKVLTKARKRAIKQLNKTNKLLSTLKTDLNPIMVSREV
jgi:hypothetical protein